MRLFTPLLAVFVSAASAPAVYAQDGSAVETLPPQVLSAKAAAKRDLRGLRIAKPGALAFASYDADGSLLITETEIKTGAARSFTIADANSDGAVSIFEQQDWAAAVGAHDGALANSTTFDANFDRRISQQEFVDGMVRLSRAYADPQSGALHLSDLLEAPAGANKKPRETQDKKRQPHNEQISRSGMQ